MDSGQDFAGRAECGLGQCGLGFLRAEGCGLRAGVKIAGLRAMPCQNYFFVNF